VYKLFSFVLVRTSSRERSRHSQEHRTAEAHGPAESKLKRERFEEIRRRRPR